jgi:superfamily I DNA/RNA helicase
LESTKSIKNDKIILGFVSFASSIQLNAITAKDASHLVALINYPHLSIRNDQLESLKPLIGSKRTVDKDTIKQTIPGLKPFLVDRIHMRINCLNESLRLTYANALRHYFTDHVLNEYAQNKLKRKSEIDNKNASIIATFLKTALTFKTPQSFVNSILANEHCADAISLTSLNSSKGRAWDVVIIPACIETVIPYEHPTDTTNVEDERRLMYVGITRAKKKLCLLTTQHPSLESELKQSTGQPPKAFTVSPMTPSRFLYEMQITDSLNIASGITYQSTQKTRVYGPTKMYEQYLTKFYAIQEG